MQFTISDFNIIPEVLKKFKDLINLIISSTTIESKDDKQYWISSLSTMTDDQIKNLYDILNEEKKELAKIEDEYSKNVNSAKISAINKIKAEEMKAKKIAIAWEEKKDKEKEKEVEEDLLKQLENA